jgi:hypothetical protein
MKRMRFSTRGLLSLSDFDRECNDFRSLAAGVRHGGQKSPVDIDIEIEIEIELRAPGLKEGSEIVEYKP